MTTKFEMKKMKWEVTTGSMKYTIQRRTGMLDTLVIQLAHWANTPQATVAGLSKRVFKLGGVLHPKVFKVK